MEAVSGVVVAVSAPLRQARRFFFLVDPEISNAAASDSFGKSRSGTSKVTNLTLATRSLWAMAGVRGPETAAFPPGHCPE
jgi:hypothetical protein